MSGFERSAPVPGSQGPRRSQMMRYNNAPPPMTPWRQEVLEAQKQLRSKRSGSKSRSRSRSREKKKAKEAGRKPESEVNPLAVLRQAREHGEGWYAAVTKAAQNWDSIGKRPPLPEDPLLAGSVQPAPKKAKEKEKQRKGDSGAKSSGADPEVVRKREDDRRRAEEEHQEQERKRLDFEAKAEERRLKTEEERRKAENDKKRLEEQKKERASRLKGAFAIDGDDDDEESLRRARRSAGSSRPSRAEVPLGASTSAPIVAAVLPSQLPVAAIAVGGPSTAATSAVFDPVFSEKVGFEKGLSPAEAFMRLQERKRKGRATEFGGPPRGCSPWRDGKRGITYDKSK